jgi:hypothetical protein
MRWLLASIVSSILFATAALSTFVPLTGQTGTQYAFVWPGGLKLAVSVGLCTLAVVLLYRSVLELVRRLNPDRLSDARSGHWLAPVAALGAAVLGFAPAAPGAGEWTAVIAYFLLDLRWWWFATVCLLVSINADRLANHALARVFTGIRNWTAHSRLLLFDGVLFTTVITIVAWTTPYLRSDTGFHGDEPKYVRYCEVWYQGGGFEVSQKQSFEDFPVDASPQVLEIIPLLARGTREEAVAFWHDVRGFVADPQGFQWNRAVRDEGFITGKRGGKYQIYQPGASVFFFPGYFLDRYLLNAQSGYNHEFPRHTDMMHFGLLVVFGVTAVALFRLFRHALGSDLLAAIWSGLAMLTLPAAAFAFQLYPELPALLLIILVTTYVWFHAPTSGAGRAMGAGALAAGLAWFHPRFLLISALFVFAGLVTTRERRARIAFLCGAAVLYLSVCLFAYRVTGSFMPTALWDAPGAEPILNLYGVPRKLLAYALDRTWGLAPHAPLLLGVVPGFVLFFRKSPWRAACLIAAGLALGVPAAGHTLHAAGGTPGRLIMAVVPLFMLPVALVVRRFWSSAWVRALTIIATVVSLESAFTYNWHHIKIMGAMRTAGLGGWRPNLAFPWLAGELDALPNVLLLLFMLAGICTAAVLVWQNADRERAPAAPTSGRLVPAASLVLVIFTAIAATALNRDWTQWEYFVEDRFAREILAGALVEHERCRVCFTNRERAIDWRWLRPNGTQAVNIETAVASARVTVNVHLAGEDDVPRFGRVMTDFGDGSPAAWTGIVSRKEISHAYRQPGQYSVAVWVQLPNGEVRGDRRTLTVGGD